MLQAGTALALRTVLSASDALRRETEPDRGGLAATDVHLLRFDHRAAFIDEFRAKGVGIGGAYFEGRGDQRALSGGRGGGGAIDGQASASRQADENLRRSECLGRLLVLHGRRNRFALGHRLRRRIHDGSTARASNDDRCAARGRGGAAMAALLAQTREETAVAAAGATGRACGDDRGTARGRAAMMTTGQQAAVAAGRAAALCNNRAATGARATRTAMPTEVGGFTAGRQGQHQHCGIHVRNLLQIREANPR